MVMLVALLQLLPAAAGCLALWWLWRSVEEDDRMMAAAGFLARAFTGIGAFWISWLRLPFASGLQLGNGFWFFGLDGINYYKSADLMLSGGLTDLILFDRAIQASQYVQLLALGRLLGGVSIAVALLINLSFYLGAVSLVSRWRGPDDRYGRRLAIATLAFMPTWVLWSLQPLKEAFFVFLIVVFVDGARRWAGHWANGASGRSLGIAVAEMFTSLVLIGGVRWYFGFILWYAFLASSLLSSLLRRRDRARELVASVVLFFLLSQALILTMWIDYGQSVELMFRVVVWLQQSREGFEAVEAATTIFPGPLLAELPMADLLARSVACVVPRFIAMPAGLVLIGGGRGLWAIAETDTIVFLVIAVLSALSMRRIGARLFRDTVVVLLAGAFCGALSMLWVLNNFGTLLRLREMLILPLILAAASFAGDRQPRCVPDAESAGGVTSRGIQE